MNLLQRDGQEGTDKLEKLDGKMLQVQLTGFLHKEAPVFTALLWKYMLDITAPRPPVVTYQRQAQPLPLYPLFPLQPPVVIYHNVKSEPGDRDRHRDRDRDREYNREPGDQTDTETETGTGNTTEREKEIGTGIEGTTITAITIVTTGGEDLDQEAQPKQRQGRSTPKPRRKKKGQR